VVSHRAATVLEAWKDALAGDPVSAFGGILITNGVINKEAAEEINKIFFEVIIAPDYDTDALEVLMQKKNRIILIRKNTKTAGCSVPFVVEWCTGAGQGPEHSDGCRSGSDDRQTAYIGRSG
jgi:AICAR transformylase/IMP cyclohydrolase PurH